MARSSTGSQPNRTCNEIMHFTRSRQNLMQKDQQTTNNWRQLLYRPSKASQRRKTSVWWFPWVPWEDPLYEAPCTLSVLNCYRGFEMRLGQVQLGTEALQRVPAKLQCFLCIFSCNSLRVSRGVAPNSGPCMHSRSVQPISHMRKRLPFKKIKKHK